MKCSCPLIENLEKNRTLKFFDLDACGTLPFSSSLSTVSLIFNISLQCGVYDQT